MSSLDLTASAGEYAINDLVGDQAAFGTDATSPVTPAAKKTRKPRKPSVKKEKAAADNGDMGETAENGEAAATPSTPDGQVKTPKKRGRPAKAKKEAAVKAEGEDNGEGSSAADGVNSPAAGTETKTKSSGKKRASKEVANGEETPSKKPRTKAGGIPESLAEFSETDLLIVNMKKEGRDWAEITAAWQELSGKEPGKDVLRKRWPKLQAVLQEWKEGDAEKLTIAKRKVEEDHALEVKKFEQLKWGKIAEAMKAAGSDDYKPAAIEKKWETMKKQGHVNDAGVYQGPELNAVGQSGGAEATGGFANNADVRAEDPADIKSDGDANAEVEADETETFEA